jgi:hypothetical protein
MEAQRQNFDSEAFNVIFELSRCENIFREKLVPQTSDLCNCCPILITNGEAQRQNFDSDVFNVIFEFSRCKNIFLEKLVAQTSDLHT